MGKGRRFFDFFFVIFLFLSACSTPPNSNQAAEDFAVYAAAFKFEFKVSTLEGLVVDQQSHILRGEGQSKYLNTVFKDLASPALVADFIAKNQVAESLEAIFAGHPEITLLSHENFAQILATPGRPEWWNAFHARYPQAGGTISASMIGYDPGHTHALLMVGMQSAPLAGYGEYLLLEKVDGNWQVIKNLMAWIS